jgi:hypothetical protein
MVRQAAVRVLLADPLLGVDRLLFVDRLSLLVDLLALPASVRLLLQDGLRARGL